MATAPKPSRILLWSFAIAALPLLYWVRPMNDSPPLAQGPCTHLPQNIKKLGATLDQRATSAALDDTDEGFALRAMMQDGDTVHEYETGVTGGHLVLRGKCYIGQVARWIR